MAGKDISCDYFTVLVKNGPKVKSKSLESIELQKTLAQVAEDTGIGTESIDIYASEKEICDTPTHVKDMTITMQVVRSFGWRYLTFYIRDSPVCRPNASAGVPTKSAFEVMLNAAKTLELPPEKSSPEDKPRADYQLYNDFLKQMKKQGIGFTPNQKLLSKKVCDTITSALWYMDPHHAKLQERGSRMTEGCMFANLHGYYDYKKAKKAAPKVRYLFA